jgi:hypothetical protein
VKGYSARGPQARTPRFQGVGAGGGTERSGLWFAHEGSGISMVVMPWDTNSSAHTRSAPEPPTVCTPVTRGGGFAPKTSSACSATNASSPPGCG